MIGALACSAAPSAAQGWAAYVPIERQDPAPFADRFLDAYRAGDEAALEKILDLALAELEQPEPFLLAHELFARHVLASLDEQPEPGDLLDACALFAERAGEVKANAALPGLIATWRDLERPALEREGRLLELLEAAWQGRQDPPAVLEALEAARPDLAGEPRSPAAGLLLIEAVYAARELGRFEQQCGFLEELDHLGQALDWPVLRSRALGLAQSAYFERGMWDRALESTEDYVAVCEEAQLWSHAAEDHVNLAYLHRQMGRRHDAVEHLERAIELRDDLGERGAASTARGHLATVLKESGELDRALEVRLELQDSWRALGVPEGVADNHTAMGDILRDQGRHAEALAEFEAALALHEDLERPRSGDVLGIGQCLDNLERYQEAIEVLTRAREVAEAEPNPRIAAAALGSLGTVHQTLGHHDLARELLERSQREREAIGDRRGLASGRLNLSSALSSAGLFAEALTQLELARMESESLGMRRLLPKIDLNMATLYIDLDLLDRAMPLMERALDGFEELGLVEETARALVNLVSLANGAGENERALAYLERAEEAARASGSRDLLAGVLERRGRACEHQGQFAQAAQHYGDARSEYLELGDLVSAAHCQVYTGRLLRGRGENEEALSLLHQALEEYEVAGARKHCGNVRHETAHIHLDLGLAAEALGDARRSMELRMDSLQGLGEVEAIGARGEVLCCAHLGLAAVHALGTRGEPATGPDLEEALWLAESGRCLLLAEALTNRGALLEAHLPGELLGEVDSARERVDDLKRRLLVLASAGAPEAERLVAARAELNGAYDELEGLVARVQRESRRIADVVYPTPVELAALQEELELEEALVLYQLSPPNGFALVVRPDRAALVRLGSTEQIRIAVQRYIRLAGSAGSEERDLARELHDALLTPLEMELGDRKRLLISPAGPLTFLPFEALLGPGEEGGRRVLERWELVYVPSGTVLSGLREEAARTPAGRGLLALGDPVYPGEEGQPESGSEPSSLSALMRGGDPLPRLRGSGAEVRAIAELYPEEQRAVYQRERATLSALGEGAAREGSRLAAVHLACHGILDAERPRLTGLVFSHGETLTVDHLYRMSLLADLVVLSACDSGRGEIFSGEGVLGLVRGFFFAGCLRVVVSNWRVEDESTSALMVAFYRHMREGGLAPAAALRAAKLERLRAGGATAHPYHWASFVLWGLGD